MLFFHARGEVLEVGAGTGRNIPYYRVGNGIVRQVILTDSSDKMLGEAKSKVEKLSKKAASRFQTNVVDASNMSRYEDNSFDTVVDSFGICSFENPESVLREMSRVCKPNGKILLLEHGRSQTFEGLTNYLDRHAETHAKHWGCVWNKDIVQIVREAGLIIETFHTWHFGTTYYLICRPNKS
mmetsp:Transcript_55604/g.67054  ORF Transcript_55604/g.67054 Transcript_55604/m.67054 type:complete len:182 (+) Transcript_55604:97-642(+)